MVSLLEPAALLAFNFWVTAFHFVVLGISASHPLLNLCGLVVVTGVLTFVEVVTLIAVCRFKAKREEGRQPSKSD